MITGIQTDRHTHIPSLRKLRYNHFPDPVTLSGEGQYNLNILKMIDVTPSFLGLDENIKKCQNKESFDYCTTHYYLDTIRKKCNCVPLAINTLEKVDKVALNIQHSSFL